MSADSTPDLSVTHPVLRILHERRVGNSKPGQRTDPHKVGLAVEGGGMRGVVSAAMLAALEEFGFADCFDAVYGASAGAISGAYFLAGETWKSLPLYYRDLPARGLIDLKRVLRGRSILDLDLLFDDVMEHVRPLDYEKVLSGPVPLGVAVTLVDRMEPLLVTSFESKADLKEALRAGSWRPVLVRGTAEYRGQRAVDGSMLAALPYTLAVDDGCTHVLSLSTFPTGGYSTKPSLLGKLTARQLDRARRGLGALYLDHARKKYDGLLWLASQRDAPNADPPFVLDLAPASGEDTISRWETRLGPLVHAVERSYEMVYTTFRMGAGGERASVRAVPRWTVVPAE
ncbi:patatin-like phospholipase family protein [Saccharothrix luteola]|uniref:patatin-like phospholipase family protein n=1 Tax=Saccharothrix luteola TaxID=2893018 RepID=UPI001E2E0E6D|nr:patatin-like phospholipase family protein [Saccharothrix luteola]MCC8250104.1 patatin-like phospholipase family protein [Saccharothrix luteola]